MRTNNLYFTQRGDSANRLPGWRSVHQIPAEQDGALVARMEQVLKIYARPYQARFPVVCMVSSSFSSSLSGALRCLWGRGEGGLWTMNASVKGVARCGCS